MGRFILSDKVYGQIKEMEEFFEKHPEMLSQSFEYYGMTKEEKFTIWWKLIH